MTLVKSVTSVMALYPMQHDKLLVGMVEDIEKVQRGFIWGDSEGKKGWHAISWTTLCGKKLEGGIGIKCLRLMNEAFLLKLLWRMQEKPKDLWVHVLQSKYNRENDEEGISVVKSGDSRLWKELMKLWNKFQVNMEVDLGNGSNTKVWKDRWVHNIEPLIKYIPENTSVNINLTVQELTNSERVWDLSGLEGLVPDVILQQISKGPPLSMDGEDDRPRWKLTPNGYFSVASAYSWLLNSGEGPEDIVWKTLWKLQVPERTKVFLWRLLHDRIATKW